VARIPDLPVLCGGGKEREGERIGRFDRIDVLV
jgi:hypothetical protein